MKIYRENEKTQSFNVTLFLLPRNSRSVKMKASFHCEHKQYAPQSLIVITVYESIKSQGKVNRMENDRRTEGRRTEDNA